MGKSVHEGGAVRQTAGDDPTTELDVLEQTISIEGARALRQDAYGLGPAPIPAAWVLEGNPAARNKLLAGSSDELASTYMWDCTAGRFNWLYEADEVAHVLEGSAIIESESGARRRLQAGDTFLFPAGSRYQWTVPHYMRKVAFLHSPLSRKMQALRRMLSRLAAPFRRKQPGALAWKS